MYWNTRWGYWKLYCIRRVTAKGTINSNTAFKDTSSEDINRTTLSILEIITTLLLNTGGNSNDNNDNSMPTIKPLNSTYYCQLSLHTWEGCAWLRKHSPVMFGSTKVSFRLRFDSASASVFTLYEGEWRDVWICGHKWKKEAHGLVWKYTLSSCIQKSNNVWFLKVSHHRTVLLNSPAVLEHARCSSSCSPVLSLGNIHWRLSKRDDVVSDFISEGEVVLDRKLSKLIEHEIGESAGLVFMKFTVFTADSRKFFRHLFHCEDFAMDTPVSPLYFQCELVNWPVMALAPSM